MDIRGLVEGLIESGNFQKIINNPLTQFGVKKREYLGASLLPEKMTEFNAFVEEGIKYRTVVANAGTRYSPVQIKGGVLSGAFEVRLGESDIGSHFTGADYDALIRMLQMWGGDTMSPQAVTQMTEWADKTIALPLVEHNEKNRWQAIVNSSVTLTGDNGYQETVQYSNPPGHRVAAAGQWSNNAYDPYNDIMAGAEVLAGLGYTVNRMFCGTDVRSKLTNNANMIHRVGRFTILPNGANAFLPGRASHAQLSAVFGEDGLPPLELYDLQYRTQTSSGYFLPRGTFVMVATTGRDQRIDLADQEPMVVFDTLGYQAIGRPAGQSGPGRVMKTRVIDDSKPPRIEGEGWQTSLPVILEPEAVFVVSGIS
ncbi:MAG: major capsid protein [Chloroflexi bacterium]|nr:major capsid protein [Chloroflexota bacterium]